jgi:hypothetical protein
LLIHDIITVYNHFMRKTVIIALLAMSVPLLYGQNRADAADDEEWFDEIYNRPTYFPDFEQPHDYPNNMSYFVCTLDPATQERLYNYEVAVYDEADQLRATGRSRKSDKNVCTLTIMGTDGEMFHFKVLYGDFINPTIVDMEETCTFVTNDVVGGFANPFWLTSSTTFIQEVGADTPTTGDAIYNLRGQRLAAPVPGEIYVSNGKKHLRKQ